MLSKARPAEQTADAATDRPRVAWFTPFTKRSGIGACGKRVVDRLTAFFEVDVWYPDLGDELETSAGTRPFSPDKGVEPSVLASYDHVVYHLGNNFLYHASILETAKARPGIVVIHDVVMYHFFAHQYLEVERDQGSFIALFDRLYGAQAARRVSRSLEGLAPPISESGLVTEWSLLEEAVGSAIGVVTHSNFCRAKIEEFATCPVTTAMLSVERPSNPQLLDKAGLGLDPDRLLTVVAGDLNRNKRAESAILALGSDIELGRLTTLAFVGGIEDAEKRRLSEMAKANGLEDSIVFTGFASDQVFYSYLSAADICLNLRHPNTEGASASAIEQMLFENVVVVLDTGFFAELPDYAVARVRLTYEQEDLVRTLRDLIRSPARRQEVASRARAYAEVTFHPDRYVETMREFFRLTSSAGPLLELTDEVSRIAGEIGCRKGSKTVDTTLRKIDESFSPR